jgi:DNA-directed RNA polymerase specialized sigma subunit
MKKVERVKSPKSPVVRINKNLSKYNDMPVFQKKVDLAKDFLEKHPPVEALQELKDKRIKKHFEEGKSLQQIASLVKISEMEVSSRLKEMKLLSIKTI